MSTFNSVPEKGLTKAFKKEVKALCSNVVYKELQKPWCVVYVEWGDGQAWNVRVHGFKTRKEIEQALTEYHDMWQSGVDLLGVFRRDRQIECSFKTLVTWGKPLPFKEAL